MTSHESEASEDKQKLQMKTFSELAEFLARIPPKITLYGLLFKYNYNNYVGCLLLLMFSIDKVLIAVCNQKGRVYLKGNRISGFRRIRSSMAGEKRQKCWPKLHNETKYERQLTAVR